MELSQEMRTRLEEVDGMLENGRLALEQELGRVVSDGHTYSALMDIINNIVALEVEKSKL